jgi:hypothetical protein
MQPVHEMLIVPLLPAAQPPYERRHPQPQARRSGEYAANLAKINGPNCNRAACLSEQPGSTMVALKHLGDKRHGQPIAATPPRPNRLRILGANTILSMQVSAHKRAVSLFERYAKAGDNIKLKDWAKRRFRTFSIILRWRICWTTERSSRPRLARS